MHVRDATFKRMKRILRHYRKRYTTVVLFAPSQGGAGGGLLGRLMPFGSRTCSNLLHVRAGGSEMLESKRQQKGSLILYSLPYLKHE